MAINLTRLFTGLGKIIASVNSVQTYRGTTLPARVAVLDAQYASPLQELIDGLYANQNQAITDAGDSWLSYLQNLAVATVLKECDLDRPLIDTSLNNALGLVAAALRAAGETVTNSPTVLAQVPSLTVGDGLLVFENSINQNDLYYTDSYLVQCTQDQTTGATAYSELISITGKAAVDGLDYRWPTGSGVLTSQTMNDSANDTLVPSSFSTWTASGTVAAASGNPRPTGSCYQLTGNGSYVQYLLPALAPGSYSWTLFVQGDAGNAALSTVTVEIVNASGATVANLGSFDATVATWEQDAGVWNFTIQPPITPSTYYLRIKSNSAGVIVAKIALPGFINATPLYSGGPVLLGWSGATPLGLADLWTASVTRASSETVSLFRGMERLFGLSAMSPFVAIPTGSPGTYTNALVV